MMNDSVSTKVPHLNRVSFLRSQAGKFEAWVVRNSDWLAIAIIVAAFAVRVAYASSCYLNPDEAQHFDAARVSRWFDVFLASHRLAHPPLLIFVLHSVLLIGRSELTTRLPSVVGGTAALWLTFAWIRRILGKIPAFAGLLFMAISPAAISASTEVRQYGLLLCFVCGSLYATERALTERSIRWAIVQGLFLLLALLTDYTATVAICSIDIYVLLRCLFDRVPRRIFLTLLATQLILAAILVWLYFAYIRNAKVFSIQSLLYLRPMRYDPSSETLLEFSRRAFARTFSYMVSQRWAIRSLMAIFLAGILAVVTGRGKAPRLIALLIVTPFVVGFVTALVQVLPFAGSRHQTYLLPFFAVGYGAALLWIPRRLAALLLVLALAVSPIWLAGNRPDNNQRTVPISDMKAAIGYIHLTVSNGAPLFVDDETHYMLRYYLGRDDKSLDSLRLQGIEKLSGHPVFHPATFGWTFNPNQVLMQVNEAAKAGGVPAGASLWIVSDNWLNSPIASQLPAEKLRSAREFGPISVIEAARN